MPIPKPEAAQNKDDYLKDCIPYVLEEGSATDRDQATAICSQTYDTAMQGKSLEQKWSEYKQEKGEQPTVKLQAELKSTQSGVKAVLTKEMMDRDGEIVSINGIDIKNYKDNPVLIDAHDMNGSVVEKLLGRVNNLKKTTKDGIKELVGELEFAPTPNGDIARKLVEGGFSRTLSIGFSVNDYDATTKTITKSELYETSLVIVPSNVGARIMKNFNPDNTADEMIKKLKNYEDIHPKIKEYRRLFMSDELAEILGYEKTGNELVDIKSVFDLIVDRIKSTEPQQEETPQEEEETPHMTADEIAKMVEEAFAY